MSKYEWRQDIKEWLAKRRRVDVDPELAIRFFRRAFERTRYPEKAWFGVHDSRISLVVGGVFLAAIMPSEEYKAIWMLLDRKLPEFERSMYPTIWSQTWDTPLFWLHVEEWDRLSSIVESEDIWRSYSEASVKIFDAPVVSASRDEHQKKHKKQRLSDFFNAPKDEVDDLPPPPIVTPEIFPEGGSQEVILELRKRNPQLRKQAINKYGYRCQVCGFDFEEVYGEIGAGFIEVHHLFPLSDRPAKYLAKIEDVTVVCANCHRMLHRNGKVPLTIKALQQAIKQQKKLK